MANRHPMAAIVAAVSLRLVETRGGLLMSSAMWLGRLSESLERLSKALHQRAMQDYCTVLLAADDDRRHQ